MSDTNNENIYSKKLRAGKRRTYFFDVRTTKSNDYFVTITESKRRFNGDGYDRHKIFLYKEDFNKFLEGLNETIDHVKTDLMPNFDFDAFNHDEYDDSYPRDAHQNSDSTPVDSSEEDNTKVEKPSSEISASSVAFREGSENTSSLGDSDTW